MVVGDDQLQPLSLGPGHLGRVTDAAVHRDHEPGLGRQLFKSLDLEAVTLGQPVGDIGDAIEAQLPQELVQHRGGGNAVGVVVAIDGHRLTLAHRPAQTGGGDFQVRQLEGGIEALQGGVQKGQDVVLGGEPRFNRIRATSRGRLWRAMTAATNSGCSGYTCQAFLRRNLSSGFSSFQQLIFSDMGLWRSFKLTLIFPESNPQNLYVRFNLDLKFFSCQQKISWREKKNVFVVNLLFLWLLGTKTCDLTPDT